MTTQPLRRKTSQPTLQYVCLGIVFVISMTYQLRFAYDIWWGEQIDLGVIMPKTASATLDFVSPPAAKAGLQRGDFVVAVNGHPYLGTSQLARAYSKAQPGDALEITVRRADGEHTVTLHATRASWQFSNVIYDLLLQVLTPIFCLLLGCWTVLVRPRDRLAWLLLALLLCFSQLMSADYKIESWDPGWRELAMVWHMTLATTWPIAMFLFGLFFPEPFPWWKKLGAWRKWLPWLIAAPLATAGAIQVAIAVRDITDYNSAQHLFRIFQSFAVEIRIYAYCVVGFGFFTSIFVKSATAISQDARRRLLLLYWGATAAMSPILLLSFLVWVRGKPVDDIFPSWAVAVILLMLLIFPLTLAYVIVVQRAMDVRVVVRQGLQYGLAQTGIRMLQFLAIAVVIATALALGSNSNRVGKVVVIAIAVTVGFSIPRFGDRLRNWTDRRFFREAYNAEQVLSELSDQVRSMVETRPLIETVAARLSDTLHIPQVAVLLSGGGPYLPACALGFGTTPTVKFSAGTGTARVLRTQKEPARVYFDDPDSWLYRNSDITEEERNSLSELKSELLLPLNARDKLLGFISLGRKRSEEPYSGTDVRLLKSVAVQTGLALENAHLMSAIADEVAQRERLNREVEIAREVQERLFPQTLPPVAGLDYAGICRPALGVGGDYYDFLALPGGQLGIAVGDVSGKGIAAALMMASLQASLRGEATRAPENLAALVSNVNRLVYEASASNRYATFFYAQYNPATRRLTYVNAGHNPPMLFHPVNGKWELSRLENGGTVVGLMASFPYQQDSLNIEPGDVFVAFTDGISEAMNSADEEWGEEKLIATVKGCKDLSSSDIIARILQDADAFVAGAKQHDDMTLVVLRAQLTPD